MARGNWRSGKDHGVAEVGSARRVFDGWPMRVSGKFATSYEANQAAKCLEEDGYRARVTFGRTKWTVWRTFRRDQTRGQ